MHYIVFDLEFNQDFTLPRSESKGSELPFEILQFGALKLNIEFQTMATFHRLVKPTLYKKVSPFITELTGIQTEQLTDQEEFPLVYEAFLDFIGDPEAVFCVWGMSDVKELFRNAEFHKLDQSLLPKYYINLQPYVSLHLGFPKTKLLRLQYSVDTFRIPQIYPFHDAYHDAYYTAELFKKVYQPSIQPKLYNPNYIAPRPRQIKKKIDFDGLFRQFNKMYDREMTEDEKGMIRLAYQMGKTHQFLIEETNASDE